MRKCFNLRKSALRKFAAVACLCLCSTMPIHAQRVALKSNALYWAAASPNLGLEFRINRHITFDFEGTYNRLDVGKLDTRAMIFTPEMRYWFSARPQTGHFVGLMGVGADYDITLSDNRHKGDAFGAGLTYGYSFVLGRHWSLETSLGVGGIYRHEKSFAKDSKEPDAVNVRKWNAVPLKVGATFVYIIK